MLFHPFLHLTLQVLEANCHEAHLVIWGASVPLLGKQRSSDKFLLAFGWAMEVSHASCPLDTAGPSRQLPIQMGPHPSFPIIFMPGVSQGLSKHMRLALIHYVPLV